MEDNTTALTPAVQTPPQSQQAVAMPQGVQTAAPAPVVQQTTAISSPMNADALQDRLKQMQEIASRALVEKVHYGTIPGAGQKRVLLKPGAEALCTAFSLAPRYTISRFDMGGGHLEYQITCQLIHHTGLFAGEGVGSCSTMEKKYRYRRSQGEAVSTGNEVPQAYWETKDKALLGGLGYFPKKSGRKWYIYKNEGAAEQQENPDIADTYNTVLKMAKKRALIDAVLNATAASDIFTQDIDEPHIAEAVGANYAPPADGTPPPAPAPVQTEPDAVDKRFFDWPVTGPYAMTPKGGLQKPIVAFHKKLNDLEIDDRQGFIDIIQDPANRSLIARAFEIWPSCWTGPHEEPERGLRHIMSKLSEGFNIIFLPNGAIDPQG